jgi:hypothetical protein
MFKNRCCFVGASDGSEVEIGGERTERERIATGYRYSAWAWPAPALCTPFGTDGKGYSVLRVHLLAALEGDGVAKVTSI